MPNGFYPYIKPLINPEAGKTPQSSTTVILLNRDILSQKLKISDPTTLPQYFDQLYDKGDLKSEKDLDPDRCVGFCLQVKDASNPEINPMQLTKRSIVNLQPASMVYSTMPDVEVLDFSRVMNPTLNSSFCGRHLFTNIYTQQTNHKVIIFQEPDIGQKSIATLAAENSQAPQYDRPKLAAALTAIRIVPSSWINYLAGGSPQPTQQDSPPAAVAPADEMAKAEKFEAAQAAARERKEAIERAENAAAAQDHYNMDDLDNSLPKEETDTTD